MRASIEGIDRCSLCDKQLEDGFITEQNCGTCDKDNPLWPENHLAVELYERLNTQFVYDFNAVELIFQTFLYGMKFSKIEAIELIDKLVLIHSIVHKKEE